MTSEITKRLKGEFVPASYSKIFEGFRKTADFEKGVGIVNRHARDKRKIEKDYYAQYDTRVEQALKRLIDKAGGKNRNYVMRFMGVDKFDKSALKRQAHRDVQFDHKRRLALLAQHEKAELRSLFHGIKQRDAQRQKAKQDFSTTTDRRSGLDRRQTQSRTIT